MLNLKPSAQSMTIEWHTQFSVSITSHDLQNGNEHEDELFKNDEELETEELLEFSEDLIQLHPSELNSKPKAQFI